VDVRVEFSLPISIDVHNYGSDTSDAERESGVESTVTTFSYRLSNQPLEFLTMIHQIISDFSSFSWCLKMCTESSIPLSEFVAYSTRHPICLIFASLEVMSRVSTALHLPVVYDDTTRPLVNCNGNYKFSVYPIVYAGIYG